MPLKVGKDRYGPYVRWGNRTKYYFDPKKPISFSKAYDKAINQMRAIFSSRRYSHK